MVVNGDEPMKAELRKVVVSGTTLAERVGII